MSRSMRATMVAFLVGSAQMRQPVNFPMAQTLERFPDPRDA